MATEKRLIDANALIEEMKECAITRQDLYCNGYAKEFIDNAPTVDAVEVVRCKDCAKAVRHEVFPWSRRCLIEDCRFSHTETHFCSYGERKDNV